nr:hypothetical protein [Pseudomonas sp. BIGb0427]
MALQLSAIALSKGRAIGFYSGKTREQVAQPGFTAFFFTGRATVCLTTSATGHEKKEQPRSAIIATLGCGYVQPACNRMRNRTAHPWCATATAGTITGQPLPDKKRRYL